MGNKNIFLLLFPARPILLYSTHYCITEESILTASLLHFRINLRYASKKSPQSTFPVSHVVEDPGKTPAGGKCLSFKIMIS